MEDYLHYKDFGYEDFLDDEYFIGWVVNPTEESNQFWESFLQHFPGKKLELHKSQTLIKAFHPMDKKLSASEKEALWKLINKATIAGKNKTRKIIYWIAAACTFTAVVGSFTYMFVIKNFNSEINYASIKAKVPFSNDIKLIMDDSTEVNISKTESELKYNSDGKVSIDSQHLNLKKSNSEKGEIAFNQLVVPRGKRSSILFSDGTKLWLNSGSRAIYPIEFESRKREIFIEGEAYLEVSHDEARPFIVKTDLTSIEVLGTSFNVSAYPDDKKTSVVLVKGSVRTTFKDRKEWLLNPNQMISYDKKADKAEMKPVDVFEYIGWKEGWLFCNSERLESVFKKLSRYYNYEITFADERARSFQLSGKLDLKENIDQVLHIISTTAPVQTEKMDNQIIISSN